MVKEFIEIYNTYKKQGLTPDVKKYMIKNLKWYQKHYNELTTRKEDKKK